MQEEQATQNLNKYRTIQMALESAEEVVSMLDSARVRLTRRM